jgi:hypothetical protein
MNDDIPSSAAAFARALLDYIARAPTSDAPESRAPRSVAQYLTTSASLKAAVAAGSLALPPGPLGWLTIVPEMIGVLRIQGQLVADIAQTYGRKGALTQEEMIYCLFRHSAAQAVRDLVVRVGERVLIQRVSTQAIELAARRIGVRLTERGISRAVGRWLPIIGAAGVGTYAYYDTSRVGSTAIEIFERFRGDPSADEANPPESLPIPPDDRTP